VDAFFAVSDAMVVNQTQRIINMAIVKKLPTMFQFMGDVINGGLASYDVSLHEAGRLSAKYVQRILTGVRPEDLPVEGVDKINLVINLKTAKQIGLTIPPNVQASRGHTYESESGSKHDTGASSGVCRQEPAARNVCKFAVRR
jgi:putative ABC transport system substrate-binding protein